MQNTDQQATMPEYPDGFYGDIIRAVKRAHPDTVVFVRIGDFLQAFGPDAKIAEQIAEVRTYTPRSKAYTTAGFPHHVAHVYIDRLTAAGYKVAVLETEPDAPTHRSR